MTKCQYINFRSDLICDIIVVNPLLMITLNLQHNIFVAGPYEYSTVINSMAMTYTRTYINFLVNYFFEILQVVNLISS